MCFWVTLRLTNEGVHWARHMAANHTHHPSPPVLLLLPGLHLSAHRTHPHTPSIHTPPLPHLPLLPCALCCCCAICITLGSITTPSVSNMNSCGI